MRMIRRNAPREPRFGRLPELRFRWFSFLASGCGTLFLGAPALAQEKASGGGVVLDYLNDGGFAMYVILGISVLGTILFLERAYDLYLRRRLPTQVFLGEVLACVERRRFGEALSACDAKSSHPLVTVLKAGLLRANRRSKEIERAMEKEMLAALPGLSKRISILSLLANAATLTGLLGTIYGLITAFNAVSIASAAEKQTALAGGISQAMYTTAFGITVALPLLFFHHFLAKRNERITLEVEGGATALLVALSGGSSSGSSVGADASARRASSNGSASVPLLGEPPLS